MKKTYIKKANRVSLAKLFDFADPIPELNLKAMPKGGA
jgi:hypothetical protein